ncbi:hypothetical protein NO2_1671, partial [Candidatus Termititenax persephonae]
YNIGAKLIKLIEKFKFFGGDGYGE